MRFFRRAAAGLPPTTSDEDTSDEEIPPPVCLLGHILCQLEKSKILTKYFRRLIQTDESEVYLKRSSELGIAVRDPETIEKKTAHFLKQ